MKITNKVINMDSEETDSLDNRYLTFHVAGEDYGIEIAHVTEIVQILKIISVPDMPDYIKGVINLRGQVIPIMEIRTRFKMDPIDYHERTCIIVVKVEDQTVGLIVDMVKDVVDIPADQISDPPKVARAQSARFLSGIGTFNGETKIILDVSQLLFDGKKDLSDQADKEVA